MCELETPESARPDLTDLWTGTSYAFCEMTLGKIGLCGAANLILKIENFWMSPHTAFFMIIFHN
jgi:hypothetical protein